MKSNYIAIVTFGFIALLTFWIFYSMQPQYELNSSQSLSEFSTDRAFEHVKSLAKKPHYVGSKNHKVVANYLETKLKNLGLEVKTDDSFTLLDRGVLVKSHNIMARIKGSQNSKCLLLLSHYDSAPHSASKGASDDGAGIATILEGVRTFIHNNTTHKNDIIILFSDAEEVGLNGAAAFVTKNKWAKEVGLVINFEARGTSGPSYMLVEVNKGNASLIENFKAAKTEFPVANSLMYSIYKMLPNDTDLTVFRELGNIQGFNFAFIDDHFNYHTAQDDANHLDKKSLAHQGSYLMPLMNHFANANLQELTTNDDLVYFNTPLNFVSYPFSWSIYLSIVALIALIGFTFVGLGKRLLDGKVIASGFVLFLSSLVITGLCGFLLWKMLLLIYPQYRDILHGFTYNGHSYIYAFICLTIGLNFIIYNRKLKPFEAYNFSIAPLFIWIIINIVLSFYLPGAGFFIISAWCSLLLLAFYIITQKSNLVFQLLLIIPVFITLAPLTVMFPIGLGLKMLYVSSIFITFIFALLSPIFVSFKNKKRISLLFLILSIGFYIQAHLHSSYEVGQAKPNSLLYVQDQNSGKANWVTYDVNLDEWTNTFFKNAQNSTSSVSIFPLASKYNKEFTFAAATKNIKIPSPSVQFLKDSISGTKRFLKILISPNRIVNRYDIFAPKNIVFNNFRANNTKSLEDKGEKYERLGSQILRYYVIDNEPLLLEFDINSNVNLDMDLLESSFDLMENPIFNIPKRSNWMMPTPFVLTDAVVIKQKIKPTTIPIMISKKPTITLVKKSNQVLDRTKILKDTL